MEKYKPFRMSAPVIAVLIILVLLINGILPPGISVMTSVPTGYTGIMTTFGKVESTPIDAGFHLKKPWQRIVLMDNRVQMMRIAAGTERATTSDSAETADQQLIPTFEFEVQYQLIPEMSYAVYENYGENYADRLITANALQKIKEVFATYEAESIVRAKAEIPLQIGEKLSEITEPMGVHIVRVNMKTYDFSPEYTRILEERALLNAQLENTRMQQQNETIAAQTQYDVAVKQAEKEAETKRIAAENARDVAIIEANAQAETKRISAENEAFVITTTAEAEKIARLAAAEATKAELEAQAAGLTDQIIAKSWIERWDGHLMPSIGDTGIGFTNYTDIIEGYLMPGNKEAAE